MSAPSHWTFGASTLCRVVESEGPLLSPFEVFADCTQAHLDANRPWLLPRFQDAASGLLIITIQSFLVGETASPSWSTPVAATTRSARGRTFIAAAGGGSRPCDHWA